MISSWRRTRRWLSPYPPGRSQIASLSFRIHVKWRGVIPSAHFPLSFGGISVCVLSADRGSSRSTSLPGRSNHPEPLTGTLDPASARQFAGETGPGGDRQDSVDGGRIG